MLANIKSVTYVETSDPQRRPTFQELLEKLRDMQRKYTIQFQAARSAAGDNTQREL